MQKSHFVVKKFSLTMSYRKNYNEMLDKRRFLPINKLEQDHNGTRTVAACKLIKSALRIKRGTLECCREFKIPDFLTEEDWKKVREFEGTLRETSRLTAICQNEDKLNGACGLVMRKALHDILSRDTMALIYVEQWSDHKEMTHPTRSEVNAYSFVDTGKVCGTREFLGYE